MRSLRAPKSWQLRHDGRFVLTSAAPSAGPGYAFATLVSPRTRCNPPPPRIISRRSASLLLSRFLSQTRRLSVAEDPSKSCGAAVGPQRQDVTGIRAASRFPLIEALGVIERSKISAEMKDLDHVAGASTQSGVRFALSPIPGLLKPRLAPRWPRAWADSRISRSLGLVRRAASGGEAAARSFPVDKTLPRDALPPAR